jgi:hypothetical protein
MVALLVRFTEVRHMQCFVCGEAMRVVVAAPHDTIDMPGFELRTFQCVGCGDVEKRMCFESTRSERTVALVPEPVVAAPVVMARPAPVPAPAPAPIVAPVVVPVVPEPLANGRMKAILGSLVRLRGNKLGR